ncbi:hypothetical protein [Mucilaginibacter pocheonensis]|uniref:LPS export ABC transporter periplasmic protein LptC n=1 Tax=Mucilaginibacter pocheonensis TaxID=398050 RepID=A0ABU1TEG7_9SPHI|nr:hypothetical protein [Mucilaginibacter pocheonensis]MDR6943806.1 hypothetical protein [Mucilaginibacter pocheonensis]
MKPLHRLIILQVFLLVQLSVFSCGQNEQHTAINISKLKTGNKKYTALFKKDSASLTLSINSYGKATGHLLISYYESDPMAVSKSTDGNIVNGTFKGDTLFADYNFKSDRNETIWYSNPIVLLHKGDTLIMGSGRILSYLGRNYFDPNTNIDFKRSRFRFVPAEAKK